MPKVNIHIEFDSIEEARSFFGQPPAAAFPANHYPPSGSTSQSGLPSTAAAEGKLRELPPEQRFTAYTQTPAVVLSNQIASSQPRSTITPASIAPTIQPSVPAVAPSGAPEDLVKLVHSEVNELIKRVPSGAGAAKSKEILLKHGFSRIRDVNDAGKAQAIIADLRAA
jgi:hypothetical protein